MNNAGKSQDQAERAGSEKGAVEGPLSGDMTKRSPTRTLTSRSTSKVRRGLQVSRHGLGGLRNMSLAAVLQRQADRLARKANREHFSTRRGLMILRGGRVCFFNNNPYSHDKHARDRELVEFRAWLAKHAHRELAFGIYPTAGEDAGYTFAMVIEATPDVAMSEIVPEVDAITEETHRRDGLPSVPEFWKVEVM